jgi:hypothetical protein
MGSKDFAVIMCIKGEKDANLLHQLFVFRLIVSHRRLS